MVTTRGSNGKGSNARTQLFLNIISEIIPLIKLQKNMDFLILKPKFCCPLHKYYIMTSHHDAFRH